MDSGAAACGGTETSMIKLLNNDALEEVFVHCSPRDLLALRSTCGSTASLLDSSEKVWLAKLRECFGLNLRASAGATDGLFVRLARHVFEASRVQQLRFQGVFVNGGIDEDAMHYFVDNMFRQDKAPYCSNCTRDADCLALLLDGVVPRDVEFAQVRQYMIRRCRYAAALILNVQMPEHGRDPDDIIHILEDWTDMQLEGFYKDLVSALQEEHALGRLLLFDIPHDRLAAEEQKILNVHQWLLERPRLMKEGMLKAAGDHNTVLDTSVLPKLTGQGGKRLAGVVHEVVLSRVGNLTCPVQAGAVVVGSIDHSRVAGWPPEDVLALLQHAVAHPACAALSALQDAGEVQAAAAAGTLPPIVATDQTLAGVWHEFDTSPDAPARQTQAAAAALAAQAGGGGRTVAPPAAPQPQAQGVAARADPAPAAGLTGLTGGSLGSCSKTSLQEELWAGIITWKPLLWFKFHSADEATTFLQGHRQLVERHGAQATVRHYGPPPARRYHVPAAVGDQLPGQAAGAAAAAAAPQQQAPGPALQAQQQQQQAAEAGEAAAAAQQAIVGLAAAVNGIPAHQQQQEQQQPAGVDVGGGEEEDVEDVGSGASGMEDGDSAEDDGGGSSSGSSGSDMDEVAEAQGAWINNWAQQELGADLEQLQEMVVAGQGLPFDQMDEGSSSSEEEEEEGEEDEEQGHFALGLDGDGEAGFGAGNGGGAAAAAAAAGPQAPPVQVSAVETLLRAVTRRNTRARNRLRVPLSRPVGANIALVKLISQENLMDQYGDPHSWPNIDMTHCGLVGRRVELPDGVVLAP
ncbi:hypothetical protein D9Q98_003229 [Chlorella vulgaris]|uniref:F-box domain-containing protein n=1 Tax=Chlorella vulgaris TaxID=3077 RepID=A0A9D4YYR5_CHLVU|nr:hypothetical protein D9Q98_003229 [Chlorella vulgaris]